MVLLSLLGHLTGCIKPEIAGPESPRLSNFKEAFVFEQTPPPKKRLHAMVEVLNLARTPQFCNGDRFYSSRELTLFRASSFSQNLSNSMRVGQVSTIPIHFKWDISFQLPLFSRGTLFLAICRGVKQCER
jgi:hypothetical protein